MPDLYAIIPAYEPLPSLPALVRDVLAIKLLKGVIVVDDGSVKEGTAETFAEIEKIEGCCLLRHPKNKGKGASMKTAFRYLLEKQGEDIIGAVTVDADGQHLPVDIGKVLASFLEHQEDYVLGVRDFSTLEVKIPWRSRFGNNLTEKVFKLFTGTPLKDTQTGLRVYPRGFMKEALNIKPDRYEFELEALLRFYRCGMGVIRQVPITTVYEENNPSSHFNPIKDSIRIYAIFFKFIGASVISSIIDFMIFSAMILCLGQDRIILGHTSILISLLTARIISCSVNFILDKEAVFGSKGHWVRQSLLFFLLAIFLFAASYFGIRGLQRFGVHPILAKILVEGTLFFLSFAFQNSVIFRSRGVFGKISGKSKK
ncbi:glycosyltransferase family 2 protein [bacterium]|nr:glycosyltransferase family 2 protein [bacterium]